MGPLSLDPTNPFSPLSPVHPLNRENTENTETKVVAPLPRYEHNTKIDWTVDSTTWILLGIAALLLAGWLWRRRRNRIQQRKIQRLQILEMETELRRKLDSQTKKPKKPSCQSCSNFISCSMAGVTKCPLLEEVDG